MLAVRTAGTCSAEMPQLSGKRAAAGALGTAPAANPVKPTPQQQMQPRRIVSSATQQAIFVDGRVDGVSAKLLVDTGSAVTIIHRRLWERGRGIRRSRKLQQLTGGPVVAANGEPLSIMGQTRSRILLADKEFDQEVLVADNVSQDCLLGADFLETHGFTIDLRSRVLSSGAMSTSLTKPHTTVASVCRVSVCSSVVIRPGELREAVLGQG